MKIGHGAGTTAVQLGNLIVSWSRFYSLPLWLVPFPAVCRASRQQLWLSYKPELQVKQLFITHQHFKHQLLIFNKIESGKEVALVAFSIVLWSSVNRPRCSLSKVLPSYRAVKIRVLFHLLFHYSV